MPMWKWCSLILVGLLAAGAAAANEEAVPRVFPYPTHVETLDNGLEVILVPMSSDGLVAYWSVVRTGSRDEYEPGHTGFAHFFEHMMFRGTKTHPADVYNEMVTEMGADTNAYTTDDLTAYHLGFSAEDLERVMLLESDRFKNLHYEEQAFQTEAGAVYGEYRKNRMNPFFALAEAVQEAAFVKHTYGHTTMGYVRDIKAMPEMYEYSMSFFDRYYRPENVILLIAGDIEADATMQLVRRYYGDWEPGYVAPTIPVEPEQTKERRVDVDYPGRTLPILLLSYKFDRFDPSDANWVSADLLTDLVFGETSAIHKKLVLDEQVAEFVFATVGINRDPGLLEIYARVKDPAKVDYVMSELDRVIAEAKQNGPDPQRLADVKSRMKYGFLMGLDTPDRVAGGMARYVAVTGGVEAVDQLFATMEVVTPENVRAAAERYLRSERRTVAVLRGKN